MKFVECFHVTYLLTLFHFCVNLDLLMIVMEKISNINWVSMCANLKYYLGLVRANELVKVSGWTVGLDGVGDQVFYRPDKPIDSGYSIVGLVHLTESEFEDLKNKGEI